MAQAPRTFNKLCLPRRLNVLVGKDRELPIPVIQKDLVIPAINADFVLRSGLQPIGDEIPFYIGQQIP